MGSVYRAVRLNDEAVVALKIVNLMASQDGRAERRFEREVESGARIVSPYVARTLDSGKLGDSGVAWLAMEFAEGVRLDDFVAQRGELSVSLAAPLLTQLFSALAAAHREGIVHRDLTPANVRVQTTSGSLALKVLDFGIAKDFGVDSLSGTMPGLGTPLWTAPEQGRESYQPRPAADVWALGLLTFFVLTGRPYWRHAGEGASVADLAIELLRSEIEPASLRAAALGAAASLPSGFDAWFTRAVAREESQRFVDASAAWEALAPQLGLAAEREGSTARGADRERPSVVVRPLGFVTLVIASCVGAGLAIYWLLRSMHI